MILLGGAGPSKQNHHFAREKIVLRLQGLFAY
jgi:hypothetical protein